MWTDRLQIFGVFAVIDDYLNRPTIGWKMKMMSGLIVWKSHRFMTVLFDFGLMLFVHRTRLHILRCRHSTEKKYRHYRFHFRLRNWALRLEPLTYPVSECSKFDFCPGAVCRIRPPSHREPASNTAAFPSAPRCLRWCPWVFLVPACRPDGRAHRRSPEPLGLQPIQPRWSRSAAPFVPPALSQPCLLDIFDNPIPFAMPWAGRRSIVSDRVSANTRHSCEHTGI